MKPSAPKPGSSAESTSILINFSIQNLVASLVQHLFPSRLRKIKEKGKLKSSRTP